MILNIHLIHGAALFLYGSLIGSFLNVCIFRVPQYKSISFERSHCPHCDKMINAFDNIPLISFIFLRGRCRNCKEPISVQYFIVELITAVMFVAFYMKFGFSVVFLKNLVLSCLMIVIFFIDLKYQLIFDRITFGGVMMGLICSLFFPPPSPKDSLLGVIAGYMFFVFIFWFGIILLFFSDFLSELKIFIKELISISSFKPGKYFKEFFSWFLSNWDIICIPFFLIIIIAFSMGSLCVLDFFYSFNAISSGFSPQSLNISFGLFFSMLFLCFIVHIIKDILTEEICFDNLRTANQLNPVIFGKIFGLHSFIGGAVFWEEDEELPPIGGGDAKFGALIGAFIGWEKALLSFFLSIVLGAFIGLLVVPIRIILGKYRFGKTAIPFGPVMIFATFIMIFYQNALTQYYYQFIDWYFFTIYGFY